MKKLLYKGVNIVKHAFPAPINAKANRYELIEFVVKNIPRLDISRMKLATTIFRFPYRSARIPHGRESKVHARLLNMKILPRLWAVNPRATK